MNATIEEQLSTLTQSVAIIATELNSRRGEASSQTDSERDRKRRVDDQFGPLIEVTTNVCDYDFSAFETSPERKVVAIVKAPVNVRSRDAAPYVCLTVKHADGKSKIAKVQFRGNRSAVALKSSAGEVEQPTALPKSPASVSNGVDLGTIPAAAFAIEARMGTSEAWRSFCAFSHGKGRAHCVSIAQPLIAANPFPAGSHDGQKVAHVRALLVKHVSPDVARVAGITQELPQSETIPAAAEGTIEAWKADANARHEFNGSFGAYQAFHARGNRVLAARIKLEREVKPRFVNGRWELSIGAHEREWLESPAIRAEFPTATSYAAFARRYGSVAA